MAQISNEFTTKINHNNAFMKTYINLGTHMHNRHKSANIHIPRQRKISIIKVKLK